jgi:hypothetical protein
LWGHNGTRLKQDFDRKYWFYIQGETRLEEAAAARKTR